jgi:O-antigen ligase
MVGLATSISARLALVLIGLAIPLYGILKSVRPMLYAIAFLSTFAQVLPIQYLGLPLASGLTLNFFDLLIIFCTFIPWAVHKLLRRDKLQIPWSQASTFYVLIFVLATISFFYGVIRGNSFNMATFQYRTYIYALVVLLVTCDEIRSFAHLMNMIKVWLVGIVITGFIALSIGAIWGNVSDILPNLFTNPGSTSTGGAITWRLNYQIGASATLGFAVLLAQWLRGSRSKWIILGMVSILDFIALSLTRVQFAALGVVFFATFIALRRTKIRRWLYLILIPIFALSLVVIIIEAVPSIQQGNVISNLISRISTTFNTQDPNLMGRISESSATISDISLSPVIGFGLGAERPSALLSNIGIKTIWNLYNVHNTYLFIALQMGIGGSILFVLYLISSISLGWNLYRLSFSGNLYALVVGITVAVLAESFIALAWPSFISDPFSAVLFPLFLSWLIAIKGILSGNEMSPSKQWSLYG